MKAISVDNEYRIYDDSLKVHDALPAQAYTLHFSQRSGFYLMKHSDFDIGEKIYGVHTEKVTKVLASFAAFDRNMGVILSGKKGIGKSLFAKMLAVSAIAAEYPVIIVNQYIPGIADYLASIEQEVVVLLDEFEKTFGRGDTREDVRNDPQTEMLTLFDGVFVGKKLFVITCNELRQLNDYLVNRPGRFHYHFRFDYPDAEEIRHYLTDKLKKDFFGEIEKVVAFSRKVDLNFDCLRSIAFELNRGECFESAIRDLNIINLDAERYSLTMLFDDGSKLMNKNAVVDLFNPDEEVDIWFKDNDDNYVFRGSFSTSDCVYNSIRGTTFVDPENVHIIYDKDDKDEDWLKPWIGKKVAGIQISRVRTKDLHYMV